MRAFTGTRSWLLQRWTALAILILLIVGAVRLLAGGGLDYEQWHALAASSHGGVLIVVFFLALALHAWVGVRDVALDYVHPLGLRLALLAIVATILAAVVLRVSFIVMGLT